MTVAVLALQAAKDEQQEVQLRVDSLDSEAIEASVATVDSRVADCRSAVAACKERLDSLKQGASGAADRCASLQAKMQVPLCP